MTKHSTKFRSSQVLNVAQAAHVEVPLPLLGVLEDVEHAFFGLCIDAGKQVLSAMMEHDRTALCGLPWKPDPESTVRRAGSTESPITLGGRRISIARPRARTRDGQEVSLPSFEAASDRDPLDRQTLVSMAAGVSTRRYAGTLDRLPQDERERATSKSAVSRRFAALTEQKLGEWLSQPLDELDLKVVMIDGIHFADHCILVALGIDSGGYKHPLGIMEGCTHRYKIDPFIARKLTHPQPLGSSRPGLRDPGDWRRRSAEDGSSARDPTQGVGGGGVDSSGGAGSRRVAQYGAKVLGGVGTRP